MASLPADITKHVLSFLAVAEIPRGAALCKAWSAAARARELWLALCEARWPSTVSGALRQAVLRRGPREYYRQHASALRGTTPQPLLDLDDHLIQLELSQNGRVICSVAQELRDVMTRNCRHNSLDTGGFRAGLIFENLRARIDTSTDDVFPPEAGAHLSVSYVVIRKSDGRVATLVPADALDMWTGSTFGMDDHKGKFAAYPSLRGYLPAQFEQPTALGNPHVHMIRHNPSIPKDLAADYLLNRLGRDYAHEVTAEVQIGEDAELPRDGVPWTPSPDASVVVGPGYVEIRRLLCTFTGWLKDYAGYDEGGDDYVHHHNVGFDDLHSALTTRLVFR